MAFFDALFSLSERRGRDGVGSSTWRFGVNVDRGLK
jgi:hypothetical protein